MSRPVRGKYPSGEANLAGDTTLHQLLKQMVEMGASDLHLTTNSPPMVRLDGRLIPLPYPP